MKIKTAVLLGFLSLGLSMTACADDDVSARLRSIEAKQDEILARLAELKEQVEIVKVRATR